MQIYLVNEKFEIKNHNTWSTFTIQLSSISQFRVFFIDFLV